MQNTAAIAIIVVIALVGAGAWSLQNSKDNYSETPESITIGTTPHELNALIYVAEDQGFFSANGLNVTVKDYDSGLSAVNGMLKGDVDIAMASEFIIVGKAFKGEKICNIACISKSQYHYLVGQTDNGIKNVSDLEGKRIGVPSGTAAEFYLGRFLNLNGMNVQQVTLVDIRAPQSADAIAYGDADAVLTWQPHVNAVKDKLGNGTFIWPAQSSQDMYWNAICTYDWARSHPVLMSGFLDSLAQAENYYINHQDEVEATVKKRLHYEDSYIETVWPENRFSLSLDQSLVTAMEDEGRWMIKNRLTNATEIPDFRDHIYTKGLEAVKPEAVNIK